MTKGYQRPLQATDLWKVRLRKTFALVKMEINQADELDG